MNLISGNCFGGHTYKYVLCKEYENPFIWTRLYNSDLIYLIEHFNELNFINYSIEKTTQKLLQFHVMIDNKITIAICYDFDHTLTPFDMQEQGFLQ